LEAASSQAHGYDARLCRYVLPSSSRFVPIVRLAQISLAYGHVPLLDHVDFVVDPGQRWGLIGRNGTGKSSLLKLVAREATPDDGEVWQAPGLRVARVAQEPELAAGQTIFAAVAEGLGPLAQLLVDYHAAAHALGEQPDDAGALDRLHSAQEALDAGNGWTVQHRIEATLARFDLDPEQPVAGLSGGTRKRVALARALVSEPDLLLLDEPTNHLDLAAIESLEERLVAWPGSLLFVTHDRSFLDRVATDIVELDRGRLAVYGAGFAAYQSRKAETLAVEAEQQRRFDKLLAQEEVWIRKGIEARRTRNEGRVRRLERLRVERAARRDRIGRVELAAVAGERSGKLVAELEHVTKRFGDRRVVNDFSCRIQRGDKVGVIGANGSGKTTLLRLILGEEAPDSGMVRRGTKLAVAYFDQLRAALDEEATLAETISPGAEFFEIDGTRKHVVGYLGEFLFPPERVRAPVKSLSGGERNRLLLARLFSRPANVLVLDEPTNDLDIETLELLEQLLQDYTGTLLLVSHDRMFLDNVVTQTIAAEGDGRWKEYVGGYADWLRTRAVPAPAAVVARATRDDVKAPARADPPARNKLSYRESRDLAELPDRIEALEREQRELGARIAEPAVYRDDPAAVKAMQARFAAIEAELEAAFARWEALETKRGTT
jgi:ATP-binding cassette subfamily F protein uup